MATTILIVDDEPASRHTIEAILSSDNYNLIMASTGPEALEKAKTHLPDIILLDVMLPGMTGFEVCQKIRADVKLAEIPIIIITALDDKESLFQGLEAGADDFISKPFDLFAFRARLRSLARLNRYRKLLDERANLEEAHRQLIKAYDATIEGWSLAMDLRDKETEGHTQRVTDLTIELAKAMGMNDEKLVHVRRGALLHDIGKLGIPDNILLKTGALTDEEWSTMHMHPQFAHDMLHTIDYLLPAIAIPYCHHEKWDGSGYPQGLKGEEIPIEARLFSVVDVWDALTSDRPYRPAWDKQKALDYIKEKSGTQFDPAVVELFARIID